MTPIVAGALSRLTSDGGVVGLGSYFAVTACEESFTSSGDTALELLMSLAKVLQQQAYKFIFEISLQKRFRIIVTVNCPKQFFCMKLFMFL